MRGVVSEGARHLVIDSVVISEPSSQGHLTTMVCSDVCDHGEAIMFINCYND